MIEIRVADPASPEAAGILWRYYDDVVGRYHGRPATPAEVDGALAEEPSDDLTGTTGAFVVAVDHGVIVGCSGIRYLGADVAELTRVFVTPEGRGAGLGARLVGTVEQIARQSGRTTVCLDTRADLAEARRLYTRLGYVEVAPFNANPYAEFWYSKPLVTGAPR